MTGMTREELAATVDAALARVERRNSYAHLAKENPGKAVVEALAYRQALVSEPGYRVILTADPQDGNEPFEAEVLLPIVPRKGDTIEVWDSRAGHVARTGRPERTGLEFWLTVTEVNLCAYAPERIVVFVRYDGYDREELERIMAAASRNDQP